MAITYTGAQFTICRRCCEPIELQEGVWVDEAGEGCADMSTGIVHAIHTPAGEDLTGATPTEIDTQLADLYRQRLDAERRIAGAIEGIHRALDERKQHKGGRRWQWPTTDEHALIVVRAQADQGALMSLTQHSRPFAEPLAAYDDAVSALTALITARQLYDAEFDRRGGWSRFFGVPSGHVHSSMSCKTCNRRGKVTRFSWHPDLSGLTEADAVAKIGPALCTVCFPSAPPHWVYCTLSNVIS